MAILTKATGLLAAIGLLVGFTIDRASQPTGGQVLTVCPEGPPRCQFAKIQAAIDAATDGVTILISPGTYLEREVLKISKNVTLIGSEPRLVQLIIDQISIEEPAQVLIQGLTIQGATNMYGAQVMLANVDVVGSIDVGPQEETEQPKTSRIALINVRVLGFGYKPYALRIGPATDAVVSGSEFVGNYSTVIAVVDAQLVMSHSLIKSIAHTNGLMIAGGAKVWLSDTRIDISMLQVGLLGIILGGIVAFESNVVLQRVKVFSRHHGVLAKNARLHMEESQVVAVKGWGMALMIKACGVNLPLDAPLSQTYEGLITGRNNEIPNNSESGGLGDVCPAELKFLKTPEGGQYP